MTRNASWTNRLYRCSLLLGSQDAMPVWYWEQWRKIARELDPLLALARGPAGTSSTQRYINKKGYVPFRRMGFGDKAHRKWTHGSPTNTESTNWCFLSAEVWAPTRGVCSDQNQPPDVFFGVRNERHAEKESLKFNPVLLLAAAADLSSDIEVLSVEVTERIGKIVGAKLQGCTVRPWARPYGSEMLTDAIGDALYVGLFKVGPRHAEEPSLAMLEGDWHAA
jgi:hypothetical protein